MAHGYFCISAVSSYVREGNFRGPEFKNLTLVPHEAETARRAFVECGLVERVVASSGELSHEQLCHHLDEWGDAYDADDPPETGSTVVLYVTGHGFVDETGVWRLVPPVVGRNSPRHWLKPEELLEPLLGRKDVKQVLLILDACFAQDGVTEAVTKSWKIAPSLGSTTDLWVIAAARREDEAQEMVFISAFVEALRTCAKRETGWRHIDPSIVTDMAAALLREQGAKQVPWVAAGYRAGGCEALPNPEWMPPDPPTWIEPRWSAQSRGVSTPTEPGYYFTGRGAVLRDLSDHLEGKGDGRPVLLAGDAGAGKTAVLARLLTTATADQRRALPLVARREFLPDSDAGMIAVDLAGIDAQAALRELSRLSGFPVPDVPRDAGPLRLLLDNVDLSVDPTEMISMLVQPLATLSTVRLVVTSSPVFAPTLTEFRRVDLRESEADIEAFLRKRLRYGGVAATELGALVRYCAGNFSAAVNAVGTLLRESRAGGSLSDAHREAARTAHRHLDHLCRATMVRAGLTSRDAADLVASLSAACSYSPDGRLTTSLWATVARHVNGVSHTEAEVEAYGRAASAFLTSREAEGGGRSWRPRYEHEQLGSDPTPDEVVEYLLAELRDPESPSWTADVGALAILLGAAAHANGRFEALLDDAQLLLAAPVPLVNRALRAVRARVDGRRRIAAWVIPAAGSLPERAFLLGLRARRNGLAKLAESAARMAPPVMWAVRTPFQTTRMALAGGPADSTIVTAHDDGSVRWWNSSEGTESGSWAGTGVAVVDLAAVHTAEGLVTVAVTGDRRVRCWGPDTEDSPRLLSGATSTAVHASGFVALVDDRDVRLIDVVTDRPDRNFALAEPVDCAGIGGAPASPLLWLVDRGGRVWQSDPMADRQPAVRSLGLPPLLMAVSPDSGTSLVVDVHSGLTWIAQASATVQMKVTGIDVAALTDRLLVVGGGGGGIEGWFAFVEPAEGGPRTRWPLDGPPVGLALAGNSVVVATAAGLAAINFPAETEAGGS